MRASRDTIWQMDIGFARKLNNIRLSPELRQIWRKSYDLLAGTLKRDLETEPCHDNREIQLKMFI